MQGQVYKECENYTSQKCLLCGHQLVEFSRLGGDVGRARRRIKKCCAAGDNAPSTSYPSTRTRCGRERVMNRDVSACVQQSERAHRARLGMPCCRHQLRREA